MPIDDEIKKGNEKIEELIKNLKESGVVENSLRSINREMNEIIEKLRLIENVDSTEAKKLVDQFKALGEEKKQLEEVNKSLSSMQGLTKGITAGFGDLGATFGIISGFLTGGLSRGMFEVGKTLAAWSENGALVNRQMYDIGANLGNAGEKSTLLEGSVLNTSGKFFEMSDNVRKTAVQMTGMGMNAEAVADKLDDVYAASKRWSDLTPEKQMQMMSMYIKEFGYSADKAWSTMFAMYEIGEDLKKGMKDLDIKQFVEQTNEVAVSMRKYGLEASDAIALTSTLVKLGVEQARIPELAKELGTFGLKTPGETAFMVQDYAAKLREEETKYQKMIKGVIPRTEEFGTLTERAEERQRIISLAASPVTAIGAPRIMSSEFKAEMVFGELDKMLKERLGGLTGRRGLSELSMAGPEGSAVMTGLKELGAPFIKELGIPGMEELMERMGKAQEAFRGGRRGVTEEEKQLYATGKAVSEGGIEAVFKEELRNLLTHQVKAESSSEKKMETAMKAAYDSSTTANTLKSIESTVGAWFRQSVRPETVTASFKERIQAGEKFTAEDLGKLHLSQSQINELLKYQIYDRKDQNKMDSQGSAPNLGTYYQEQVDKASLKTKALQKEAKEAFTVYTATEKEARKDGKITTSEQSQIDTSLKTFLDKAAIAESVTSGIVSSFKEAGISLKVEDDGSLSAALRSIRRH